MHYNHKERERKKKRTINGIEQDDIVSYESRLYRVLSVRYWYDHDDAIALLEDTETGETKCLSTQNSGLKNLKGLKENTAFKPKYNHRPAIEDINKY